MITCDQVMLSCDVSTCGDHVNYPTITCYLIISNDNNFKNKRENGVSVTWRGTGGSIMYVTRTMTMMWQGEMTDDLNNDNGSSDGNNDDSNNDGGGSSSDNGNGGSGDSSGSTVTSCTVAPCRHFFCIMQTV